MAKENPTVDMRGTPNAGEREMVGQFVDDTLPKTDTTHPHQDEEDRKIGSHPHSDLVRK